MQEEAGALARARCLKKEGQRLFLEGLYEEAGSKFQESRALFTAAGDEIEAAEVTNDLGLVYRLQGRWDDALITLEQARSTFARLGDRSREAQVLGNLGGLYATMGRRDKAKEYLRQAADMFAELHDSQRYGETLLALATQMWRTRERANAIATYTAGLELLEKPSLGQRILRGLLKIRSWLVGI